MNLPPRPRCSQCVYATIDVPCFSCSGNGITPPNLNNLRLQGHYDLTEQDAYTISQWALEARLELAQYDLKASQLRALLATVESGRDAFQQRLQLNVALTSPVRRLPTEILTEIFSLSCIPDAEDGLNSKTQENSLMSPAGRTALRLSLVCSRWRKVALGTPKLWSFINVTIYSHRLLTSVLAMAAGYSESASAEIDCCVKAHPIIEIVNLYLERSQDQPLAISVCCHTSFEFCSNIFCVSPTELVCDALLKEVFKHLIGASRRWRTAHINIPHTPKIGPPFPISDVGDLREYGSEHELDFGPLVLEVPLLEVMDIYPGSTAVTFPNTPCLHTLAVTATPWGRLRLDEDLFHGPVLRSLTVRGLGVVDVGLVVLYHLYGSDVHVTIEDFHDPPPHNPLGRQDPCTIPEITKLSVNYYGRSKAALTEFFCKYVIAPNVTEMELMYHPLKKEDEDVDERRWNTLLSLRPLLSMIRLSSMPLKVLKTDGFNLRQDRPNETMVEILRLLPTLEVLGIGEMKVQYKKAQIRQINLEDDRRLEINREDYGVGREQSAVVEAVRTSQTLGSYNFVPMVLRDLIISAPPVTLDSPPVLIPKLTSLSLTVREISDPQYLVKMVHSRWLSFIQGSQRVEALRSLSVTLLLDSSVSCHRAEDVRRELKWLQDAVLDLDINFNVVVY